MSACLLFRQRYDYQLAPFTIASLTSIHRVSACVSDCLACLRYAVDSPGPFLPLLYNRQERPFRAERNHTHLTQIVSHHAFQRAKLACFVVRINQQLRRFEAVGAWLISDPWSVSSLACLLGYVPVGCNGNAQPRETYYRVVMAMQAVKDRLDARKMPVDDGCR